MNILVVTDQLPGHDLGFQKSGHAQYLGSILDHFIERGDAVTAIVFRPKVDFAVLPQRRLGFRVTGPDFAEAGPALVLRSPSALRRLLAWNVFTRLPRRLQATADRLRRRVRRARGAVHHLGTFLTSAEIAYAHDMVRKRKPDLVIYDGIFNSCGRLEGTRTCLVSHEVKHQRSASFEASGIDIAASAVSADTERTILAEIDTILAIQWDDARALSELAPNAQIVVVPAAVPAVTPAANAAVPGRCVFVGSGSFHNYDGLAWFLESCWPRIRARVPAATLDVFGSVCYRLNGAQPGVTLHGVVDDLASAYAAASVTIVPLRVGSGLKVKLIEALAHAQAVVATPVGVQGLMGLAPRPFELADTDERFADAVIALLGDPAGQATLREAAVRCAETFTPKSVFATLDAALAVEAHSCGAVTSRLCVGVPTFRRLAWLPELLAALAKLQAPAGCEVNIVVADNDPAASARDIVTAARASFPFTLHYEHVTVAGLSSVRNAVLELARSRGDFLAMLDDDEVPEPQWLAELFRIAQATGADAVTGPVPALLPDEAPAWVRDFRAREYPDFRDGDLLTDAWSSNCLLRMAGAAAGLTFDPALNFIGGEDQLFFRQLLARGGTIAYAAAAVAWERLPRERRSVGFILKRSFRRGNSLAMCDRRLRGTPHGLALRAAKGVMLIGISAVRFVPLALLRRNGGAVTQSLEIARGVGMLAGLLGMNYRAYQRES